MKIHGMEEDAWCGLIHASQFAGYILPVLGFLAPIVMWAISKEESELANLHGKVILNWLISVLIYASIFGLLSFILIGIPLLAILGVLAVIFPIIGSVKAFNKELWKYPLSITFIK